jgi:arylsulfatase A-like enzyme
MYFLKLMLAFFLSIPFTFNAAGCAKEEAARTSLGGPVSFAAASPAIDLTKIDQDKIEFIMERDLPVPAPMVWNFSDAEGSWVVVQDMEKLSADAEPNAYESRNSGAQFLPLFASEKLDLIADDVETIVVRIRVSKGRKIYLLWEVNNGTSRSSKQLASFLGQGHIQRTPHQSYLAYILQHDQFVEYTFNMHNNNYWNGKITRLWLMPSDEEGAIISVDYIKVMPKNYRFLKEQAGTTEIFIDNIYVRSFFTRSSTSIKIPVKADDGDTFDVAIAKRNSKKPVHYAVVLKTAVDENVLQEGALDENERWLPLRVSLPVFKKGQLILKTASDEPDSLFYWGNPIIFKTKSNPAPLNIILYVIDALRADHLGLYGYERNTSPNIDALAKESLVFEHCIAQAPWTRSSMASLLTSTYPDVNGMITDRERVPDHLKTLPEVLSEGGYYTAAFVQNPNCGHDAGLAGGYDYMIEGAAIPGVHSSKVLNELVFPWLERNRSKPFFLYIHTMDTHIGYAPEEQFSGTFSRTITDSNIKKDQIQAQDLEKVKTEADKAYVVAKYDEAILTNDYRFGQLLQRLRDLNLYDNTLIIVTADHGEQFQEHGWWEHGHTCYQEDIRVPLIMRIPGMAGPVRFTQPVQSIDLFPTVATLLHLAAPATAQGEAIIFPATGELRKNNMFAVSEQLAGGSNRRYRTISDGHTKAIKDLDKNCLYLYDLRRDPLERRDIARKKKREVERYKNILKELEGTNSKRRILQRQQKSLVDEKVMDELKSLGYLK